MDVHVPRAVTIALRLREIDVLTAQEDRAAELDDPRLLTRASELGRILISQDADLLREGVRLLDAGEEFSGIVYAHQLRVTIGQMVADLDLIAKTTSASTAGHNSPKYSHLTENKQLPSIRLPRPPQEIWHSLLP